MKINTHLSIDLDAVASVWAAREFIPGAREAEVEFRPAGWDGSGMEEGDLALDIQAGGRGLKGEKGEGGIVYSCFAGIVSEYASPADQAALANLVAFVDAQDAHGSAAKHLLRPRSPESGLWPDQVEVYELGRAGLNEARMVLEATGLNAVLRALQAVHPRNDALVLERMSEIFSGMLQAGRARQRAKVEADKAEILAGGKVAIVSDSREFGTNAVLFEERGVRVVVYIDGNNLGLNREGSETLRMDHPEIRAIVEAAGEADEWFAHSAGFLYCRGSRKSPAENPSTVNPYHLAEVASRLLAAE